MGGGMPGNSGPLGNQAAAGQPSSAPTTTAPTATTGFGTAVAQQADSRGTVGGTAGQSPVPGWAGGMPGWTRPAFDPTNTTTGANMGFPSQGSSSPGGYSPWASGYQGIGNINLNQGDWNWGLFDSRPQYWDQWRPNQVVPGGYEATRGQQPYPTVPGVGVGSIWPTPATAVGREGPYGNENPAGIPPGMYGGPVSGATDPWMSGRHSNYADQAYRPYGMERPMNMGFPGMGGGMMSPMMSGRSASFSEPGAATGGAASGGYAVTGAGAGTSFGAPTVMAQGTPAPTIPAPVAGNLGLGGYGPAPPDLARLNELFGGSYFNSQGAARNPQYANDASRWAAFSQGNNMSDYTRWLGYNGGQPGGMQRVDQFLAANANAAERARADELQRQEMLRSGR